MLSLFLSCQHNDEVVYTFDNIPDRIWPGEDFWTVPLEGWHVKDGRVECLSGMQQATFSILPHVLTDRSAGFKISFEMGLLENGRNDGSSGIIIGKEAMEEDDVRAAVFFGQGINMGVHTAGYAFIEQQTSPLPPDFDFGRFKVEITGSGSFRNYVLTMNVTDMEDNVLSGLSYNPENPVSGIIQLVNNFRTSSSSDDGPRFWYDNISLYGDKLTEKEGNSFGPVLWTMHTLSRNTLKMTAQLPPVSESENQVAELQVNNNGQWQTISAAGMDPDARNVTWRDDNWDSSKDHEYRVLFKYIDSYGENSVAEYAGKIRRDPVDRPLRMGSLTCQYWLGFPYSPLVKNLELSNPDILYFSGDQIYEWNGGYGVVRWPEDEAIVNYLGKWYMFGWAFGDLMRDIPTIVTPDDHDVYHGNLWGEGGVPCDDQHLIKVTNNIETSDKKGFLQTVGFVNMVNTTQCSHLPDPYDPSPIEQGMSVWYTGIDYGRISFAVVSDRIFKSAPERVSHWEGRHDHILSPLEDPGSIEDEELELLGERQEIFIEEWIRDWKDVDMKALLSQTPFSAAATNHGQYEGYLYADLDAGGWPKTARDRAVRIIRKGFAFHITGDQHLTSIIQYGVESFRDAGYSYSPPAISVIYSRWFRPDELGMPVQNRPAHGLPNTGEYVDAFGNPNYVYAIGNPGDFNLGSNRYENEDRKAAGYGMVIFDKDQRTITIESWRFLADVENPGPDDQFPGWPLTISQSDNYGREAKAWLPTLNIEGDPDPVVEVINQETDEFEYSVRIRGNKYIPKVFSEGLYTIRLGYPERDSWKVIDNIKTLSSQNQEELLITF
jgi:alkaline phosphatase D